MGLYLRLVVSFSVFVLRLFWRSVVIVLILFEVVLCVKFLLRILRCSELWLEYEVMLMVMGDCLSWEKSVCSGCLELLFWLMMIVVMFWLMVVRVLGCVLSLWLWWLCVLMNFGVSIRFLLLMCLRVLWFVVVCCLMVIMMLLLMIMWLRKVLLFDLLIMWMFLRIRLVGFGFLYLVSFVRRRGRVR